MKLIEYYKLKKRANKYKNKNDKGGIAYILSAIKDGQTVFDIGAHKAGYLYFIKKQVGKSGKIYAFEPQLKLFNYLQKIKRLFNWNNIIIEHLALSDISGSTILYIPENSADYGSSPGASIFQKNMPDIKLKETVKTDTLDQYCFSRGIQPNLLKIDVEGNELNVFNGAIKIIQQFKPKILVEIEARHVGEEQMYATFEFLKRIGYRGYFILDLNCHPLAEFKITKHQNLLDMKNYSNNFIFE